ncbi:MAG: aldo/keto reductase [Coriobacteriales bacterium]|jgi:predicted aldo/keto reductase-like oxidoreductase|nr:aldo/keto reductase [Coriobacteriales bacterium]
MEYRSDRYGNKLSVLGFGLMRLPVRLAGIDLERSEGLVLAAVDGGVNYFDTAYLYTGSEEVFGRILARNPELRQKLHIATKLPHSQCRSYEDFDRLFNEQLRRLQVRSVDYYLIHNLADAAGWQRLVELGIERWVTAQQQAGRIGQLGFSFHGKQQGFLDLLEVRDWDFVQIQYNYLDENFQAGRTGLEAAARRGLPVVVMEPLRGGKLAGGLPRRAEQLFAAADPEVSVASWGFRWLFDQPEVTVVLSGMSNEDQLADNLQTAAVAPTGLLSEGQRQVYAEVIDIIRQTYKVPCTGCNYCMPCPQGVNIPGCFAAYNTRAAQGLGTGTFQYITSTAANRVDGYMGARLCIACGACKPKCPQGIDIVQSLREVRARMEPFWFGPLMAIVRRFT